MDVDVNSVFIATKRDKRITILLLSPFFISLVALIAVAFIYSGQKLPDWYNVLSDVVIISCVFSIAAVVLYIVYTKIRDSVKTIKVYKRRGAERGQSEDDFYSKLSRLSESVGEVNYNNYKNDGQQSEIRYDRRPGVMGDSYSGTDDYAASGMELGANPDIGGQTPERVCEEPVYAPEVKHNVRVELLSDVSKTYEFRLDNRYIGIMTGVRTVKEVRSGFHKVCIKEVSGKTIFDDTVNFDEAVSFTVIRSAGKEQVKVECL